MWVFEPEIDRFSKISEIEALLGIHHQAEQSIQDKEDEEGKSLALLDSIVRQLFGTDFGFKKEEKQLTLIPENQNLKQRLALLQEL